MCAAHLGLVCTCSPARPAASPSVPHISIPVPLTVLLNVRPCEQPESVCVFSVCGASRSVGLNMNCCDEWCDVGADRLSVGEFSALSAPGPNCSSQLQKYLRQEPPIGG